MSRRSLDEPSFDPREKNNTKNSSQNIKFINNNATAEYIYFWKLMEYFGEIRKPFIVTETRVHF